MPKGRSYSKKRKKTSTYTKSYKKRKRPSYKRSRSKAIKMFPKTQLVELTYCDEVEIPNIVAGSAPYKFRLNSIFDPDMTATGHQPRGHDQWNAIYNKYCVIGAVVKVEPLYSNTSDVDTTLFGYVDDDSASDQYNVATLRELNMPGSTHKYVELGQDPRGVGNARRSPNLNFKVGMKKFFGISKKEQIIAPRAIGQGDSALHSTLTAPFGFNPVSVCYLKLHAEGRESSTQTIKARVTIKYMVVVHDPKEISAS